MTTRRYLASLVTCSAAGVTIGATASRLWPSTTVQLVAAAIVAIGAAYLIWSRP